jgi:hypothetical protein
MPKFFQCLSILSVLLLLSCGQSASVIEIDGLPPSDPAPNDPGPTPSPPRFNDSFKLSWNRPTHRQNCDVLPIEEIGGYEIEIGYESENYEAPIKIEDPNESDYTVNATQEEMFYIALKTYDTDGLFSQRSKEVVVRCEGDECVDETPAAPPSDDPCTGIERKPLFEINKKSNIKRISKGKELCPNFPVENDKIPYETKSFQVSSTSGRKFQCNWRHGRPRDDHRVGYRNAKLKLPSYSAWDVRLSPSDENQVLIPLGLYQLSEREKIDLIGEVGAYPLKNDISTYFEEDSKDIYRISMARYEKSHVNVRVEYHSVCAGDEDDSKDCLDIELHENMHTKRNKVLVMKLNFKKEDDEENSELESFMSRYNRGEIAVDAFSRINATSYYDVFKVQKRLSTDRPNISEIEFIEYDELALADELFGSESVRGGGKDEALRYLQRLLTTTDTDKKARYTREEIEKFSPQTLNYAKSFWQGALPQASEITSAYATSLDILNKLYKEDHPVRALGETYRIVADYFFGNKEAIRVAIDLSQRKLNAEEIKLTASNIQEFLRHFEFAPDTRESAYVKILSLFDRYRDNLPLARRIFSVGRRTLGIVLVGDEGIFQYIDVVDLLELVEKLVIEKGITDVGANDIANLFERIYRAPMNHDEYDGYYDGYSDQYYYQYSEHAYDIQLILTKVSEYIMRRDEGDNQVRLVKEDDFSMIESLFTLFMREDLYNLYSYSEAFKRFESYYFEYKVRSADVRSMSNYFSWFESFQGPYLRDKDLVINYIEKFFLEPSARERYSRFRSVFSSLASKSPDYDRQKNEQAFKMTLRTFKDESLGTPQLEILSQMIYFMKNDFKIPNSNSALSRSVQVLKKNLSLNRERFNLMKKAFEKYLEEGLNKEVALKKALEDVNDIITT